MTEKESYKYEWAPRPPQPRRWRWRGENPWRETRKAVVLLPRATWLSSPTRGLCCRRLRVGSLKNALWNGEVITRWGGRGEDRVVWYFRVVRAKFITHVAALAWSC